MNQCLTYFVGDLNKRYEEALQDLTKEQLYFLPNDSCCHIAFHAWHFVRTEDNIINFVCQDRKSPVWMRQGLPEKWGLPKTAQGTSMTRSEANAIRLSGLEAFLGYARDVWTDVAPYLSGASEEELQKTAKVQPYGELPKLQQIVQTVLAHGNRHLGQIMALRSIQGLPGESM